MHEKTHRPNISTETQLGRHRIDGVSLIPKMNGKTLLGEPEEVDVYALAQRGKPLFVLRTCMFQF